jgi:glycosyltransferase involved in cell wall biosynthesis
VKIQLEQLDLLAPWPRFVLREGYYAMRVVVRIGTIPIGEVMTRPARSRKPSCRRLRRRITRKLYEPIIKHMTRLAMAAGPEAMRQLPDLSEGQLVGNNVAWRTAAKRFVAKHLLRSGGMPAAFRELYERATAATQRAFELPPVTVAICTRDRADQLERCLKHLLKQDYPDFDILVVDNSKANDGPTKEVARRLGVNYAREPIGGLSRARNTAMREARCRWVAFTDDDCQPEANWLRELVRELQDTQCRCVTGLVLPAQLENAAEITFEVYGGLGRGYNAVTYDAAFLRKSRWFPPHTWSIGAGANMLLDRELVLGQMKGFDVDMGPGPHSVGGCGEDTDVFYEILRRGFNIHYTPRAIVHHYHRSSPAALRKHIYSYAVGHAAYHVRCFFRYRDYRSLLHLAHHLPRWFLRKLKRGVTAKSKYPFSLVPLEAKGTLVGVFQYSWVKTRSLVREWFSFRASATDAKPQAAAAAVAPDEVAAPETETTTVSRERDPKTYGDDAVTKSVRVA